MKKEKVFEFIKELVCYLIVIIILLFIAKKFGWTDTAILDNVIGLTIGWIFWKVVMIIINFFYAAFCKNSPFSAKTLLL